MGLGETKVKQRFGLDPRNTNWSNNTGRFGHQYLEKLGWEPGKGLGLVQHATTTHVKVKIKEDNAGLGARLAKKNNKDSIDGDDCAGLDVFQRILGRLNGKESKINDELERQRNEKILNGKWGMHFIKGEVLQSSWDTEKKAFVPEDKIVSNKRGTAEGKIDGALSEKRRRVDKDSNGVEKNVQKIKRKEKEGKVKKDKKERREKKESKEKKDRKAKKEKKEKRDKTGKKHKNREKSEKHAQSNEEPDNTESADPPKIIAQRLSVRSKWIKQKRASVMDAKALNEIFMISN